MIITLSTVLASIVLAVVGSLTFWPVQHGYDFYKPLVLFIAGLVVILFIWWWVVALIGHCYSQTKEREKPSKNALFWLREGIIVSNHICGALCKVVGKNMLPKNERFLLVCNHVSNFDPMLLTEKLAKRELVYITKPENLKIPIGGKLMLPSCYCTINRDDPIQSLGVMNKCIKLIENDYASVAVYPEGTRHHDGQLGEFHEGVFNIAIKSKAPIVVTTIKNSNKIAKRAPRRTLTKLEIIKVIPFEEYDGMTAKALSDKVRGLMLENLAQ